MSAAAALPHFAELVAPGGWRTLEFISDLHLQAEEPATYDRWRGYMASTQADALFILGDLFEVWVGDDAGRAPGFAGDCAAVIAATARRLPVFLMHGNRDFLVGDGMARACGATLLQDPTVLQFAGRRWVLTHGDLLCTSDVDYQQFRAQVRSPQWQATFLGKPLAERQAIGRHLREESEKRKREHGFDYGQVDEDEARRWLAAADAQVLLHGHTHLPADHALGGGHTRVVLSDWDAAASPPRLEVMQLTSAGHRRVALA